ncbi:hypothetical protein ANN_22859 [Periplaneta americana]|uniref:Uncharacterized protein n=1 Tax=Periplaneta americana TaxID=6978 RepID=A0ABQ8SJH6_PERAM|nr:hypothetical protein ANN_22859 [Periplaneta americana]
MIEGNRVIKLTTFAYNLERSTILANLANPECSRSKHEELYITVQVSSRNGWEKMKRTGLDSESNMSIFYVLVLPGRAEPVKRISEVNSRWKSRQRRVTDRRIDLVINEMTLTIKKAEYLEVGSGMRDGTMPRKFVSIGETVSVGCDVRHEELEASIKDCYGSETCTLTMREEQRLRVIENKVLRKIFGAKRDEVTGEWSKLHNAELHALYSSPDIIRNIKSSRLRWAGHVARNGWKTGGKRAET